MQVQANVAVENLERACEQLRNVWLPKIEEKVDSNGIIDIEEMNN